MGLFAISDLHLSSDNKKSMEVFGPKWNGYMNKIKTNWENTISDDDTVLICGDISWGMYINECLEDFEFLNNLRGKKVIIKGNHDYWWTTKNKLNTFIRDNGFKNFYFLQNESYTYGDILICGSRGWITPQQEDFNSEDEKIYKRELERLKLSLETTKRSENKKIIVALHYPPILKSSPENEDYQKLFKEYNVSMCIYGHLHGASHKEAFEGVKDGVEYKMVSADYLEFEAQKIAE